MKDVKEMTQDEIRSDIADFITDALRGADEAYGLAVAAWGKNDPRAEEINCIWADCETQLRKYRKA